MACVCVIMFYNDDGVIIRWDFAIPMVGAAVALLMGVTLMCVAVRGRSASHGLESCFGISSAGISMQLDDQAQSVRLLFLPVPVFVGATAILLAGMRVTASPTSRSMIGKRSLGGLRVCRRNAVRRLGAAPLGETEISCRASARRKA